MCHSIKQSIKVLFRFTDVLTYQQPKIYPVYIESEDIPQ